MLGKLFSYELRTLWKPALVMLIIMAIAGIGGVVCFDLSNAFSEAYSYRGYNDSLYDITTNFTIIFSLIAVFFGFVVWACVIALFIYIAMRFYKTMFTDEGYLTLTLPVTTSTLIIAKFLIACLLLAIAITLCITIGSAMLDPIFSDDSYSSTTMILSVLSGLFWLTEDFQAISVMVGMLNTLIGIAYQIALAFFALALGAMLARRHKVAAAIGIYIAISWGLSLLFTISSVTAALGGADAAFAAGLVSITNMVFHAVLAVGFVVLTVYLVKNKIDLN